MISLRSQVTRKLLNYFFLNPQEILYINEISKKLELDKRNLVKKIKELEKEGILKSQRRGNLKLYSINQDYPLYEEYKRIVVKILGFEENLKSVLKDLKGVKEAYIYGSYAEDKMDVYSDIDLLVVGNHNMALLQKGLSRLQKEINREINVINMDDHEFKKRIKNKDSFVVGILKQKNIKVI